MMKRNLFLGAFLLLCTSLQAQSVTLFFTGLDAENQYLQLDSIQVVNHTRGWQETLYWPDTVLTMSVTGVEEPGTIARFSLFQNIPNPFEGTTCVLLDVVGEEDVTMELMDMSGKVLVSQVFHSLQPGIHQFQLSLSAPGLFLLTARQAGKVASVKIFNKGAGEKDFIRYVDAQMPRYYSVEKKGRGDSSNPFSPDDVMEYVGFATVFGTLVESGHITGTQIASETISLLFDVVQSTTEGHSCPGLTTVTDFDGNTYHTIWLGNQCWMKENLRTTHYADGTAIALGNNESYTEPYYYDYASSDIPLSERGYLYNWPAAMHGDSSSDLNPSGVQGVCPNGWHLPSHSEWAQLADYVGSQNEYVCGGNSNYIAKSLAVTSGWVTSTTYACAVGNNQSSNNATGFSAYPVGHCRGSDFQYSGRYTYFWSSTEYNNDQAWCRQLCYNYENVNYFYNARYWGFSVRCVRNH